jgi:hypothetical protein
VRAVGRIRFVSRLRDDGHVFWPPQSPTAHLFTVVDIIGIVVAELLFGPRHWQHSLLFTMLVHPNQVQSPNPHVAKAELYKRIAICLDLARSSRDNNQMAPAVVAITKAEQRFPIKQQIYDART